MKVKIKLVDPALPVPQYKTPGSVGFDVYCRRDEILKPGEIKALPSNLIVKVPPGYFLFVTARSSTIHKHSLQVLTGIIDQDYCGDNDEFYIQAINHSRKKIKISRGTRLAQGVIIKIGKAKFRIVSKMNRKSRGGFGTTG